MITYKKYSTLQGFTLVEVIVVATILVILTSIGFYNYTKNIATARDSVRVTDLWSLSSELSLYKRERGAYPFPGDRFFLQNGTTPIAMQGRMNRDVALTTASDLPLDPRIDVPYFYSTTINRQEYQLATSMENGENPFTHLVGDYRSVAKNLLPNILIASENNGAVDITTSQNQSLFLFHRDFHNLPYDFNSWTPVSDGSNLATLIADSAADYWQNTDYRSCWEIELAAKNITQTWNSDTYQILDENGVLVDEVCDWIL